MNPIFLNGQAVGAREGDSYTFLKENALEKIKALEPEIILVFSGEFDPHHYKVWEAYLAQTKLKACIVCYSYKNYYHHQNSNHLKTSVPIFSEETGFNINDLGYINSLKALLYPANISRNWMYFYTLPKDEHTNKNIKHIHIGHGDSDKSSSCTRVQKIYDHSLVADDIAQSRYIKNNISLPNQHFLKMGAPIFPNLSVIENPQPLKNILYIPTFEGPSPLMNYSSLDYIYNPLTKEINKNNFEFYYHPHPAMGMRQKEYKELSDELINKSSQQFNDKEKLFNISNAAICDASGVTSEYLFTGKPIIAPYSIKSKLSINLNKDFRNICYLWNYDEISLSNFLKEIKNDPLFKNRMRFRDSKFMNARSFQDSVDNFDAAIKSTF